MNRTFELKPALAEQMGPKAERTHSVRKRGLRAQMPARASSSRNDLFIISLGSTLIRLYGPAIGNAIGACEHNWKFCLRYCTKHAI